MKSRRLVGVLGALTALGPLSIDAYLPALPSLEAALHVGPGAGAVTLSAYFLGLSSAQLPFGALADRLGRRPPLLLGLALYVVGSIGCALAPSVPALALARFVQGVGGAAGPVMTRTIVKDLWTGPEVAKVLSVITLVMGVAPVLAPLAGGALLGLAGWRAIFATLALVGGLFTAVAAVAVPETRGPAPAQPLRAGLTALVRDRRFVALALASGTANATMFAYIAGSPDVLMHQLGASKVAYAGCFGLNAFGLVAASQWNRALLAHRPPASMARAAILAMLLGGLALVVSASVGAQLGSVEALLFVAVAAQGLTTPNTVALAMDQHGQRAGLASALVGTVQYGCSAVASAAIAAGANGTLWPMAAAMTTCAALALATLEVGLRAHPQGTSTGSS